jgi:hypothetical protein
MCRPEADFEKPPLPSTATMTPQQEQEAQSYKKRQAHEKWRLDLMVSSERNSRRVWLMAAVVTTILAIQFWPQ